MGHFDIFMLGLQGAGKNKTPSQRIPSRYPDVERTSPTQQPQETSLRLWGGSAPKMRSEKAQKMCHVKCAPLGLYPKTNPLRPYAFLESNIPEVTAAIATPNTKDVTFPQLGGNVDGVNLFLRIKVSSKILTAS